MSKVAVLGAGAWGTTLSILLAENKHEVTLWSYESGIVPEMRELRENRKYLPGYQLLPIIKVTDKLTEAVNGCELMIFAIPTQFLRGIAQKVNSHLDPQTLILSASKGLEESSLKRPTQILSEFLPPKAGEIAALSGPNLAREIAKGLIAATVVASPNDMVAQKIQAILSSERFRVYTNQDVVGVELGGALKNIVAIAAGAADGFELGDNAKSALLIRGIAEIIRVGVSLGARPVTFAGLSGMGDLITTCNSSLSRNHQVGFWLAKGKKLPEILSSMQDVAEGVPTCRAALKLAKRQKVDMPITSEVYQVLFEGKDPYQALISLMARTPTSE
jgi:glycerol-3-phosphate dehydrogenase (NAD(P)+)